MQPTLRIIYASTSGHTEFVINVLAKALEEKSFTVNMIRAETATPEDLTKDDVTILASGTWNTGGIEGQLNPHMHEYLLKNCKETDLQGQQCVIVALGDERYYYTARANEHFVQFIDTHGGKRLMPPLTIVNEPYDQEERITRFAEELMKNLKSLKST